MPSFFIHKVGAIMNNPISKRLLTAAKMIDKDAKVADVGCDHGYLSIFLVQNEIASYVCASDLREGPLGAARKNAEKFGVADKMDFVCADGFSGIEPEKVDTLICCGMGGDLIRKIIEHSPWVRDEKYTLILQPQSGQSEFRKWLVSEGFSILEEQPIFDDRFIYFSMKVRYTGEITKLTPGQAYVSPQMLESKSEDLPVYIDRVLISLEKSINGMEMASKPDERLAEFKVAREEVLAMKEKLNEGF